MSRKSNFFGQVSNHNKHKLQNYSEFFTHIQNFWTSNQVTSKNYKTTGNFLRMLKFFFGQVSKYERCKLQTTVNSAQASKITEASKQVASKNYKTTAVLSRKSNFFLASKQSQQVQTTKLQ